MKSTKTFLIVFLFIFLGVFQLTTTANDNNVISWNIPNLEKLGINSEMLIKMDKELKYEYSPYTNINSVVVIKEDQLIFENYYNGYDNDTLFEVQSVTKTITSALIGIAIDKGYIEGIDEKVVKYFPEYIDEIEDSKFKELTIRNMLTMTAGLDWNNKDMEKKRKVFINNLPIKYTFGLSLIREPGEIFSYNILCSHILSGIITKTTGMTVLEFADKNLFGPLGIENRKWLTDREGYNIGGAALKLKTRDMARIGYLYLNKGRWNEKQIISEKWINESTQPHINVSGRSKYGYQIWIDKVITGTDVYYASGLGGQLIFVVPELDLVIAINSRTDKHRGSHSDIINEYIIPSLFI